MKKIKNIIDVANACDYETKYDDVQGFMNLEPQAKINLMNYIDQNPDTCKAYAADAYVSAKFAHVRANALGKILAITLLIAYGTAYAAFNTHLKNKDLEKRIKTLEDEVENLK